MQTPIDMQQLEIFTGGDPAEEREIMGLFKNQLTESLKELEDCVGNNCSTWSKQVHKIKGSSLNLGANELATTCQNANKNHITKTEKEKYLLEIKDRVNDIFVFMEGR